MKRIIPSIQILSFPDDTIYYIEIIIANKDNIKIDQPEEITDEEIRKTLIIFNYK